MMTNGTQERSSVNVISRLIVICKAELTSNAVGVDINGTWEASTEVKFSLVLQPESRIIHAKSVKNNYEILPDDIFMDSFPFSYAAELIVL